MSSKSNAPTIVKRKKVVSGGGHHGGAWKVAYADFVTAMMAFFMLMWLLNATSEQQRRGLAAYFSPSVPVSRVSGGGTGALGGDSVLTEDTLVHSGTGASRARPTVERAASGGATEAPSEADRAAFRRVTEALFGRGGESAVSDALKRHIATRITDEGLVVELFARPGAPLFRAGSDMPTPVTRDLAALIAQAFDLVDNAVAVEGHVKAVPVVRAENPKWALSSTRAQRMRALVEVSGLATARMRRVTGHGDREPAVRDPMAVRNDRIEMILLRSAAG